MSHHSTIELLMTDEKPTATPRPVSPQLHLPSCHPLTIVRVALDSFWDEANHEAKGDLIKLRSFMTQVDFLGVVDILQENLPPYFEGWAKLTARYLIDHTEEIGVNNPNDLNFIKKVGRVLVQRALLTSLPDGPHAWKNETSSDRLNYTDDYRTWTSDMLDFIFQLGEWPWMHQHVHGWTRDYSAREEEAFGALVKTMNKKGIDLNHEVIHPPLLYPPRTPSTSVSSRRKKRRRSSTTSSRSTTTSSSTSGEVSTSDESAYIDVDAS